jgi:hypothetical protein
MVSANLKLYYKKTTFHNTLNALTSIQMAHNGITSTVTPKLTNLTLILSESLSSPNAITLANPAQPYADVSKLITNIDASEVTLLQQSVNRDFAETFHKITRSEETPLIRESFINIDYLNRILLQFVPLSNRLNLNLKEYDLTNINTSNTTSLYMLLFNILARELVQENVKQYEKVITNNIEVIYEDFPIPPNFVIGVPDNTEMVPYLF